MVVANPAYDSNTTNVQVLDRTAYHGTVVWSFQQALMAGGIARQLGFCNPNSTTSVDINSPDLVTWCGDTQLVQGLKEAQTRLWTSIKGAFGSKSLRLHSPLLLLVETDITYCNRCLLGGMVV